MKNNRVFSKISSERNYVQNKVVSHAKNYIKCLLYIFIYEHHANPKKLCDHEPLERIFKRRKNSTPGNGPAGWHCIRI